jgi:hypothetical protein
LHTNKKGNGMTTTQHHQVITRILIGGAIVLGAAVGLAAPAVAETANPFGNLSCGSCQTPASVTSPAVGDQIRHGLQDGLKTDLPAVRGQR